MSHSLVSTTYVRHLLFPTTLVAGALLLLSIRLGAAPSLGPTVAGTLALAIAVPLASGWVVLWEWLAPATGVLRSRPPRRLAADAFFCSLSIVGTIGGHAWFSQIPPAGVLGELSAALALGSRPLAVQVAVAFLVSELILYAWHRAQHQSGSGLLWSLRAFHHRAPQLASFVGGRAGGADVAMNVLSVGVSHLLGLDPDASVICLYYSMMLGSLHHSDLDIRLGWFNWVAPGPEQHRVHHSIDPSRGLSYATNLPLLDILFGTMGALTRGGAEPLGIAGDPERY